MRVYRRGYKLVLSLQPPLYDYLKEVEKALELSGIILGFLSFILHSRFLITLGFTLLALVELVT